MFELTTNRLLLSPIRHKDAQDLERVIFEDPEVITGLAHDGSDPDVRRTHSANWSHFGPDGKQDFWEECKIGLYVISDSFHQQRNVSVCLSFILGNCRWFQFERSVNCRGL